MRRKLFLLSSAPKLPATAQVSPHPRPEGVTDRSIASRKQFFPRVGELRGVPQAGSTRHG